MKSIFLFFSKNNRLSRKLKNNSGIIIIVVMWVLVILSTLAISLSRKTNIELSLTKYALAKQRATYLAWGGLLQGIRLIQLDSQDKDSSEEDSLYFCGFPIKDDLMPEDVLKEKPLGQDGEYSLKYLWRPNRYDAEEKVVYGMEDEERKINLNAIILQNNAIVAALLTLLDVDQETANEISASLVDWIDEDDALTQDPHGAESEYYESLLQSYRAKNRPLDSLSELLLIRGMTPEILEKMKPFITIYPKEGDLKINFNTASLTVLRALARAYTGATTNTDTSDADSFAEKIIEFRAGEDGEEFTNDDVFVDIGTTPLNAKEKVLGLVVNQYRTPVSSHIRINSVGREVNRDVEASVQAVVRRDDSAILYWKRN